MIKIGALVNAYLNLVNANLAPKVRKATLAFTKFLDLTVLLTFLMAISSISLQSLSSPSMALILLIDAISIALLSLIGTN